MSWHEACGLMDNYVVKIETSVGSGTGFFFAYNEAKGVIAVATALHVVKEAHDWRLPLKIIPEKNREEVFLPFENRAVLIDVERDSAAILFRTDMVKEPPDEMLALIKVGMHKKRGVTLGWCGYPAIAPNTLCFFQGGVSAFGSDDNSYYVDGVAIHGVSGGPVFDENFANAPTKIVGLVSAYFANRQASGALPGLLRVYDVTHLHAVVGAIKNLDAAQKKEAEAKAAAQKAGPGEDNAEAKPIVEKKGPNEDSAGKDASKEGANSVPT